MKLTQKQKQIIDREERFLVVVSGRRGGKTYSAIASLAKAARFPNKTCLYLAPTHGMCRQVMWEPLKEMFTEKGWIKKVNESNLEIRLINGSIIMLRSADTPDRLRGLSLSHVVIDEASDISEATFRTVVRPALADQLGTALIVTTPKAKGWVYDLEFSAKADPEWWSMSYTTAEGGLVDPSEIAQAEKDMGEREFRQEFLAEWVDFEGIVYYSFSDDNIQQLEFPHDNRTPIHVGIDFNITPFCATLGYQHSEGRLHIFDEIELHGSDTEEMSREIQSRMPGRKIFAYPDSSGAQRRTSATGGVTDHIILKNAGFELRVGSINPSVKDRIASVNSAFKTKKVSIDPKCRKLIESLRKHVYKEGTLTPQKGGDKDFSHFCDAVGYKINRLYPMRVDNYINKGSPIRRNTGTYR